ncbi:MAG: fibronectin type III domain-containing protein [Chloroflexi bacterium]|nr:fibronectin type III domain-containing protein [Chloroflexota bacterium]
MKARSVILIIGIVLALIYLFAALSLQAQTNNSVTITGLQYDGVNSDNNTMNLSWNTVENTNSAKLQVKGGGVVDSWMSVSIKSLSAQGSKTYISLSDLSSYRLPGRKYNFRVKVNLNDGSSTAWAYVEEEFGT